MKTLRLIGVILVSVLLLLILFVNVFLESIIDNRLDNLLENTLEGFYKLDYENEDASIAWSGFSITFEDVKVTSDTSKTSFVNRFPTAFFETDELKIENINIFQLLFSTQLIVSSISFDSPNLLVLIPEALKGKSNEPQSPARSTDQGIKEIDRFKLGDFQINNGSLEMVFLNAPDDTVKAGSNIEVFVEGLDLDLTNTSNIFAASTLKQFAFSLEDMKFEPSRGQSNYHLSHLDFDYEEGLLQAVDMEISARKSWKSLNAQERFRKTFKRISLDTLRCLSDQFGSLEDLSLFRAQEISLINLSAALYRDRSKPMDNRNEKRLLQQALLNLPIKVWTDEVNFQNASLEYEIHNGPNATPAMLSLTGLNGTAREVKTVDPPGNMQIDFTGSFMHNAAFALEARLPLDGSATHDYMLKIEAMDFESLNPLLEPLAGIHFDQGVLLGATYQGQMDRLENTGSMTARYKDFKITLKNSRDRKKWFKSGLANLLIRNKNKEDKQGNPLSFQYSYPRKLNFGHTDFLVGGLLDGMAMAVLPELIYNTIQW